MSNAKVFLVVTALAIGTAACGGAGDDHSPPAGICTVETISESLTPGYQTLHAVHGFSYEEIYVVGAEFFRYGVTSGWQEIPDPESAYYQDLWGSSPSDIFLVGAPGIHHYDGSKVEAMEHPQLDEVTAVWGTAPDNVWAAGEGFNGGFHSHLLRYDGHEWTLQHSYNGAGIQEIWGINENDIWAGGGSLLHWDGSAWTPVDSSDWCAGGINGIWGSGSDDVWFVGAATPEGNNTLIARWDGESIEVIMQTYPAYDEESSMAPTYAMSEAWGYGTNSVFAIGAVSAYYNGKEWTFIDGAAGMGAYGESNTDTLVFVSTGKVKRVTCQ